MMSQSLYSGFFRKRSPILPNMAVPHTTGFTSMLIIQGRALELEVRDDGCGITPADTSKFNSFGIRGMIERAGLLDGKLTVSGMAGRGNHGAPVDSHRNKAWLAGSHASRILTEMNILIVDDHAIVRQGLRQILMESGEAMLVGEAEHGSDAIRQVREGRWDVVVLDISLPDRSGIDILKQIKKEFPKIRVSC